MFLNSQLITYMGNKRKLIHIIQEAIDCVKEDLDQEFLVLGDGFSGSGVVSRLMKENASSLYVNDIAGYSGTLNDCYLANAAPKKRGHIAQLIEQANLFADSLEDSDLVTPWIQLHWAPKDDFNIAVGERAYFTQENARRIDRYRYFISTRIDKKHQCFLLAPLLVQASIHNNTNGHFASFYKMEDKGHFGGKKEVDLTRITKPIKLEVPLLSEKVSSVEVSCIDTNEWIKHTPLMDLVYYDPPYNKHPYAAYYFMLEIINNLDSSGTVVPDTIRGQAGDWKRSDYNSICRAKTGFSALIKNTNAKYILVSYNSSGIISMEDMECILAKKGTIRRIDIEHKTYNRMKGIASYKRKKEYTEVCEYMWLVDCRKNM